MENLDEGGGGGDKGGEGESTTSTTTTPTTTTTASNPPSLITSDIVENENASSKKDETTTSVENETASSTTTSKARTKTDHLNPCDDRQSTLNKNDSVAGSSSSVNSATGNLENSPSNSTLESDLNTALNDLKTSHLKEMSELKNQLDEARSRATIIETTKQDEIDQVKFEAQQEIDSLNHIINALQSDLNTLRAENEQFKSTIKEYKRQMHASQSLSNTHLGSSGAGGSLGNTPTSAHHHHHHHQHNHLQRHNLSPTTGGSAHQQMSGPVPASQSHHSLNLSQENENLEEDMRKAKESADMLRAVVLPLETEISTLRSRSSTSEKRIKDLEKIIDDKEKELQRSQEEEKKLIEEALNSVTAAELEGESTNQNISNDDVLNNIYFKKFIQLKKYLKRNENRFIELEQAHLKAIKQVYSLLSGEQKLKLIPNRSKSKSVSTTSSSSLKSRAATISSTHSTSARPLLEADKPTDETPAANPDGPKSNEEEETKVKLGFEEDFEKNETIAKIEELLDYLLANSTTPIIPDDSCSIKTTSMNGIWFAASGAANSTETTTKVTNIAQMPIYSYAELLALYEKEKNFRHDLESTFQQKSKESNKQIENLNREMTNLAIIIDDLRKQYMMLQAQYKNQLEQLIRINDEIRAECRHLEHKNEQLKLESLKLKAENKQFYGEQAMIMRELDDQYKATGNVEEMAHMLAKLRQEMVKLVLSNQALNKQLALSTETVKHLQKVNADYQRSNSSQDHLVITQSLESELERERKVRIEAEAEKQEFKQQLLLIKEKGQTLVETLKQRNEQNEFEIRRQKEENAELQNQIASLKKDAKNSLSVQEDLVKLIQSLQIELSQNASHRGSSGGEGEGGSGSGRIEVRCQHEDDFNDCAGCRAQFSVTKRKHRCKHCCKIFCADCCAKTVLSGPNLRPHKVCDTCHTLLDKDLPSNSGGSATTTSS